MKKWPWMYRYIIDYHHYKSSCRSQQYTFVRSKKIWLDWIVYQKVSSHWFCIHDAIPGESVSLVVNQDKHLQFVNRSQHCLKVGKSCRPKMIKFEEKGQKMRRRLTEFVNQQKHLQFVRWTQHFLKLYHSFTSNGQKLIL